MNEYYFEWFFIMNEKRRKYLRLFINLSSATGVVFFLFSAASVTVTVIGVRVQRIGEELAEREIEFSEDIARIVVAICGGTVFIGNTISTRGNKKLNGTFEANDCEHTYRYEQSVVAYSVNERRAELFDNVIRN